MAVMMAALHQHAAVRIRAHREELAERIACAVREGTVAEPFPGLHLHRATQPHERIHSITKPAFCVVAQGSKELCVGEICYRYDPEQYLLTTVELPFTGRIIDASAHHPYLSLGLDLDPAAVGSVMVEAGIPAPHTQDGAKALGVSALDADLLDATVRLVRLVDAPAHARMLAPLVTREIIYRLLVGEQGSRLRHLPLLGSHAPRITQAVERLRKDFDQPLHIPSIARDLGMSPSGFHTHFKAITNLSPLQFQKQLRLHEARRLLLSEHLDIKGAGIRVGYHDASQFSRDYKKHFGASPARDVERLRATISGTAQEG